MSLFAGHKRELGADDDGGSANFKKLKGELGALFGFGNNTLLQQHNTVVSFRELSLLDDKVCILHCFILAILHGRVQGCIFMRITSLNHRVVHSRWYIVAVHLFVAFPIITTYIYTYEGLCLASW